jgi:transcriptional regulator
MYVPAPFAVDDEAALAMLEHAGFGALVTGALSAVQLPFMVAKGPLRLIGHVAKVNPIWREGPGEGLLIARGVNAYVSPSFYASKAEHGRVVPTWNYEAVHVRGEIAWFEDRARLSSIVDALTDRFERDREHPWAVSDAPSDYVERMLGAIVGVELKVTTIEAARKLSQNKSDADRAGVRAGLGPALAPETETL